MRTASYHNTTRSGGAELRRYEVVAKSQEDLVAAYFRERAYRGFTPSQIQAAVLPDAPLTSIRRAITNLTHRGVLVKTDEQVPGPYGRPEYRWRAAPTEPVQHGLFEGLS